MGCRSGDLRQGNNISMEFARRVNGAPVFGTDGLGIDRPRILGISGTSRIETGSQYFIAHFYDGGGHVERYRAVNASSWARAGHHVRQMHGWQRPVQAPLFHFY